MYLAQPPQTTQPPSQALDMDNVTVLDWLKAKILEQCQIYLDKENAFIGEYGTLDMDKEIDNMNPTLWKCMLTRSASESIIEVQNR